jgi:thiol-disulfide isomerase/thioredoxin
MGKTIKKILVIFLLLLTFSSDIQVNAQLEAETLEKNTVLNISFFQGIGCPHCAKEKEFLKTVREEYGERIKINEYEIYYNQKNQKLFNEVIDYLEIDLAGVPLLVIGEEYVIGYSDDQTTGVQIIDAIEKNLSNESEDIVSKLLVEKEETEEKEEELPEDTSPIYLSIPIFGKVNLKSISLPLATIVIALLDGFNPCAMWILIFLITMLINMKDRKRLYILGSIFIITSGLVYFVFLAAWLNFFKYVGFVYWVRTIIGIVAVGSGILHLKDAFSSKGECKATDEKKRETIMERIKKAISEKSFILSIIGIVILAVSVNLIEVVCSAGLPAIYTSLLSSVPLTNTEYYIYLILYIIIFMIDDLIVFFLAVKTFEVTGIAKKYTKWSSIIGGIIILALGIILIVKPELLMFG